MPAVLKIISTYDDLVVAVRERCDEMGMTNSTTRPDSLMGTLVSSCVLPT
jgi:hypothetical protein